MPGISNSGQPVSLIGPKRPEEGMVIRKHQNCTCGGGTWWRNAATAKSWSRREEVGGVIFPCISPARQSHAGISHCLSIPGKQAK